MPQTDIPWPSLANSPWPMAHHDPQLTSRSPYPGPQSGEVVWISNIPDLGRTRTGVVIGVDGTLYFGAEGWISTETALVALNPDGTEKWRYGIGMVGETWSTPLVNVDGTVFIGSRDHYLYAINPEGTLKWRFDAGSKIYQGINIGLDSTLYFVAEDGKLYAISSSGQLKWKLTLDDGFQPYWSNAVAISPDGSTIYVPGRNQNLYAIGIQGNLKWKLETESMFDDLLVDAQGNIYGIIIILDKPSFCMAINSDGTIRWNKKLRAYLLPTLGLTIDHTGCLYAVSSDFIITSFDYSGQVRWEWSNPGYGFDGALVCSHADQIYCPTSQGHFYCLSGNGNLKWDLSTQGVLVYKSPAIGKDNRIYFSTGIEGAQIYCVK
jgi:outer membrane protein assembly factor BamB